MSRCFLMVLPNEIRSGVAPAAMAITCDVSPKEIPITISYHGAKLTITGTVSSPQTQVNTVALLSEEAIRYLLRQTVVGSIVTSPQLSPRTTP